jgi:thioredoxin reductase (NADPH)
MGLDATGVALNPKNGKVPTVDEQTNVPHIYAIGDVIDGDALSPPSALTELTPVAIQAGKVHMPAHLNHGTSDHALLSRR